MHRIWLWVRKRVYFKISTARCPVWHHRTWPQTASSSPMRLDVGCVRPTRGRVSSDGPTTSSVDRCFAAAGPKLWNSLLVQLRLTFTYLNVKGAYSSPWKPISEIRGVTCRMGTHSVACHPTQVNRYCFESMHGALVSRVTGRLLSNDVGPRP